jgi:hypothetical protein
MDNVKAANGSRNESSIVGSRTRAGKDQREASPARTKSLQKQAAPKTIKSVRPPRKGVSSKLKPDKLVCRYCESDDLAPSFIKRRDRRCRKCFSKRYGSAARERKAKVKK